MRRLLDVALSAWIFGLVIGVSATANAATCAPSPGASPYISGTTSGGDTATCEQYANDGNINGSTSGPIANQDPFLVAHPTYKFLDANNNDDGLAPGALTAGLNGDSSGTWSIDPTKVVGYTNFALGFKDGNFNPDWAVFLLGDNWDQGGLWAFVQAQTGGTLSHAILYAQVAPVPLPATVIFFLSGLLGLFGLSLRRRRVASEAA